MITKSQLCKKIILDFEEENKRKPNKGDIIQSSNLAVAMEYLGMLTDNKSQNYASTRGGTVLSYFNYDEKDHAILSVRELLALLPE